MIFSKSSSLTRMLYNAVLYDNIEVVEVFGYFCRTNLNFTLNVGDNTENLCPILEKLSDIKGFETIDAQKQENLLKGDLNGLDGLELLMKFACIKSSIGIIKAILSIEKFETSFLRDLISMSQAGFQIDAHRYIPRKCTSVLATSTFKI